MRLKKKITNIIAFIGFSLIAIIANANPKVVIVSGNVIDKVPSDGFNWALYGADVDPEDLPYTKLPRNPVNVYYNYPNPYSIELNHIQHPVSIWLTSSSVGTCKWIFQPGHINADLVVGNVSFCQDINDNFSILPIHHL